MKNKLKEIRESRGLTQQELADKTRYTPSYISKVENFHKDGSIHFWIEVSTVLKEKINKFLEVN